MLSQKEALRLRSIGRSASLAKSDIDLANMFGVSPKRATAALRQILEILELLPPPQRGRKPKENESIKCSA